MKSPTSAVDRKQRSREAILRSATDVVCREGIAAASVARVMAGAGMTVGGFYAHFPSKDHLAAEALQRSFAEHMGQLFEGGEGLPDSERLELAVRRYLSRQHRDLDHGKCPVPACLSEIGPHDEQARDALVAGVEALVSKLAPLLDDDDEARARERALASAALFFGAMGLARAVNGTQLSDEVLLAARKLILGPGDSE